MRNDVDSQAEDMVFRGLQKAFRKRRKTADLEEDTLRAGFEDNLSFQGIRTLDPKVKIRHLASGGVELSLSQVFAFDELAEYLAKDNPGIDLTFAEDLAYFTPEASLVKKSRVPLWVIRPSTSSKMVIERVW